MEETPKCPTLEAWVPVGVRYCSKCSGYVGLRLVNRYYRALASRLKGDHTDHLYVEWTVEDYKGSDRISLLVMFEQKREDRRLTCATRGQHDA